MVVAGGDDGRIAGEQFRHIAALGRLIGMQQVPAGGVAHVPRQLVVAGDAIDLGRHIPLLEHLSGGQHLPQYGAAAQQAHSDPAAAVRRLQAVGALEDAGLHPLRHGRLRIVLVHQGNVVEDALPLGEHAPQPVLDDHRQLVGVAGIVGDAVGDGGGQHMAVAVLMLQALAVEGGAPGGAAKQEAPRLHVPSRPSQVADALKTEHGVVDVEGDQGEAVGAVGGGGGQPSGEGAGFVDALLQHLAVLLLPVGGDLSGVLRLVQLALGRVDAQLPEHALHAEGARLVRDDGHDARADLLVAHQGRQQAHELHGGGVGPLAGALKLRRKGVQPRHCQDLLGLAAPWHEAAQALAALLQVDDLRRVVLGPVEGHFLQFGVREGNVEAVPEVLEAGQVQLLHLMGVVLRLAEVPHAVALDGLG